MKADQRFANQPISFWAYVRAITEALGSSRRGADQVSTFSIAQMIGALERLERPSDLLGTPSTPSQLAVELRDYFNYRADLLNSDVRNSLMTATEAVLEFELVKRKVGASEGVPVLRQGVQVALDFRVGQTVVRVPMNKQKGLMRNVAYLTGMVNLLVAHSLDGKPCDYDPRKLTVIDYNDSLYATLGRRMDGSYPSTRNPLAFWEIKEYYYTTTFGSKISDAVYITSLDGYERIEIERETGTKIEHLVMVDAFDTWWGKGKSYLCRLVDLLNMGHVDEVLFGREVVDRIPTIVGGWLGREAEAQESKIPSLDRRDPAGGVTLKYGEAES